MFCYTSLPWQLIFHKNVKLDIGTLIVPIKKNIYHKPLQKKKVCGMRAYAFVKSIQEIENFACLLFAFVLV